MLSQAEKKKETFEEEKFKSWSLFISFSQYGDDDEDEQSDDGDGSASPRPFDR